MAAGASQLRVSDSGTEMVPEEVQNILFLFYFLGFSHQKHKLFSLPLLQAVQCWIIIFLHVNSRLFSLSLRIRHALPTLFCCCNHLHARHNGFYPRSFSCLVCSRPIVSVSRWTTTTTKTFCGHNVTLCISRKDEQLWTDLISKKKNKNFYMNINI